MCMHAKVIDNILISYNSDYDVNVTEYMNTYKEGIRAEYMHESNNKENEAVLENVGMRFNKHSQGL